VRFLQARRGGRDRARGHLDRRRDGTHPTTTLGRAQPLRDREPVVLLDRKGRTYLRTLKRGGRMSARGAPIRATT
jgi:hypothetical protein